MTNDDDDLEERISELEDHVDSLESRVDTIGKCAALADKNRELIESLKRVVGQLGFVDLQNDDGDDGG